MYGERIMKMSLLTIGDDSNLCTPRYIPRSGHDKDPVKLHADLARLVLYMFMAVAAFIGWYFHNKANEPLALLNTSINRSLGRAFRASLEGSITLRDSTLSVFRTRQIYAPREGVSVLSDIRSADDAPFDAVTSLEILRHADYIVEYEKEDMYGHPTRHLNGTITDKNTESTVRVFDYWIDMKSLLAVRIIIAQVERNVLTDDEGNSYAKETYINIRYHSWH